MTRPTFTWNPEYEATLDEEPTVTVTKFGDGYEVRNVSGINTTAQKWKLTFSQGNASFPDVLTFVRTQGASQSFYWTNPLGETKVFVCRKWQLSRKQGHNVMTLDFDQVFES